MLALGKSHYLPTSAADLTGVGSQLGVTLSRIRLRPSPGSTDIAFLARAIEFEPSFECELVDGTLVERAIGVSDGRIGMIIHDELLQWVESHKNGRVADQRTWWQLGPTTARKPNVGFVLSSRERAGSWRSALANRAPGLAVEVRNRQNTNREMERRREDYFGAGTQIIWEVNPRLKNVCVYSISGSKLVLRDHEVLRASTLRGFRLPLADVFGDPLSGE